MEEQCSGCQGLAMMFADIKYLEHVRDIARRPSMKATVSRMLKNRKLELAVMQHQHLIQGQDPIEC
jgi:hypothetical protein